MVSLMIATQDEPFGVALREGAPPQQRNPHYREIPGTCLEVRHPTFLSRRRSGASGRRVKRLTAVSKQAGHFGGFNAGQSPEPLEHLPVEDVHFR